LEKKNIYIALYNYFIPKNFSSCKKLCVSMLVRNYVILLWILLWEFPIVP